jgi:hypothetical protein
MIRDWILALGGVRVAAALQQLGKRLSDASQSRCLCVPNIGGSGNTSDSERGGDSQPPGGIRGAQAAAAATFLARNGESKSKIRRTIEKEFHYDLSRTIASIRPTYSFNESCQETVPEAITAFLESEDYEDAIRLAISLGGDADTLACVTGGIAGAFYGGVPGAIATPALGLLDDGLRKTVTRFCEEYGIALE